MNSLISVSELNEQIKSLLETTFVTVYVQGEISNLTYHNSGHIYFSIKDEKSTISCVMFRGNARYLKFRLEHGQKVNISGSLTVYSPRGNYQLLCNKIEPSGVGALALAYEQLKTKLQIKGYFDQKLKKTLPKFPDNIFIITSNTGAAIEDMKKVLNHRYPLAKMILVPALVQGDGAKESIVKAIRTADKLALKSKNSLMIIGRGGGSLEDLWAFNEECVADAVFNAKTPVISAVGHESDFVISDFVADIRASTPSNAIELAVPDINELRIYTDSLMDEYSKSFLNMINKNEQIILHLKKSFEQYSLGRKFALVQDSIEELKKNFTNNFKYNLNKKYEKLDFIIKNYEFNRPEKRDKEGFVQLVKNKKIIDLDEIQSGDNIQLQSSKYIVECSVLSKLKI